MYCLTTNSSEVLIRGKECNKKSSACVSLVTGEQRKETDPPLLIHRVLDPIYRSKKYAIYMNNLQTCLYASNLTEYFTQEEFFMQAVANMKYYIDNIRTFIPYNFIPSLPNHCWNANAELNFSPTLVSGHFKGTKFRVNRTYFDKLFPPLNNLPFYGESKHEHPTNHSMPFSCIPEVFLAGFYKCGSTYLYSLLTSHPKISATHRKEPDWFTRNEHFANENEKKVAFFADYVVNYESLVASLSSERKRRRVRYSLGVDGSAGLILFWPIFLSSKEL